MDRHKQKYFLSKLSKTWITCKLSGISCKSWPNAHYSKKTPPETTGSERPSIDGNKYLRL